MAPACKARNLCPKFSNNKMKKNGTLKGYPEGMERFRCRRAPSIIPSHGSRGSLTVEASLVLPLFLCFTLQLISILQFLSCYGRIEAALHQTARELSVYAYANGQTDGQEEDNSGGELEGIKEIADSAFLYLYVKEEVERQTGEDYLEHSPIVKGKSGISYLHSSILGGDHCIDLVADYRMRPMLAFPGVPDMAFINRCRLRAWTGYDAAQAAGNYEGTVYVAENASVYHKSEECTHLRLSVTKVSASSAQGLRNEGGGKYYPCEICGKQNRTGNICYITGQGNRYHNSIGCSGLKRSIQEIPLNEAQAMGLPPCGRCG